MSEPMGSNGLTNDDVKTIVAEALAMFKDLGITSAVIVAHVDNAETDYAIVDKLGCHFTCRGLAGHAHDFLKRRTGSNED